MLGTKESPRRWGGAGQSLRTYVCVIQRDDCVQARQSERCCQSRTAARADMPRVGRVCGKSPRRSGARIGLCWLSQPEPCGANRRNPARSLEAQQAAPLCRGALPVVLVHWDSVTPSRPACGPLDSRRVSILVEISPSGRTFRGSRRDRGNGPDDRPHASCSVRPR